LTQGCNKRLYGIYIFKTLTSVRNGRAGKEERKRLEVGLEEDGEGQLSCSLTAVATKQYFDLNMDN